MESVEFKGIDFCIVAIWHYWDKAVILMDMWLCFYLKTNWLKKECVKVTPAIEVPKIGKQAYNMHQDYMQGKITETQHIIRDWSHRMYWYRLGIVEGFASVKKKK